ncbi:hypothetical protein D3C71_1486340 [compost metagenome]
MAPSSAVISFRTPSTCVRTSTVRTERTSPGERKLSGISARRSTSAMRTGTAGRSASAAAPVSRGQPKYAAAAAANARKETDAMIRGRVRK